MTPHDFDQDSTSVSDSSRAELVFVRPHSCELAADRPGWNSLLVKYGHDLSMSQLQFALTTDVSAHTETSSMAPHAWLRMVELLFSMIQGFGRRQPRQRRCKRILICPVLHCRVFSTACWSWLGSGRNCASPIVRPSRILSWQDSPQHVGTRYCCTYCLYCVKLYIRFPRPEFLRGRRGRSFEVSSMAATVDQKLLRQTKFPPEFNQKVDAQKINIEVMKK